MFIHIISCCSGGDSKQESPETDPLQLPGKNKVKNGLGHILLIVFIDSDSLLFLLFTFFNTSLTETKFSVQE